jgi:hypothetical protein
MPRGTRRHRWKNALRAAIGVHDETAGLCEPLDYRNEEIKLVTVNPGHFADDIHCSLSKVSLKDGLSYEALMLGAPQPPHVKYSSVDYPIVLPIIWSLRFGIYDMSLAVD